MVSEITTASVSSAMMEERKSRFIKGIYQGLTQQSIFFQRLYCFSLLVSKAKIDCCSLKVLGNTSEGVRAYLRPILLVDINTGLRRGELFSLRKYQLDFNLGCILVGKRVRQQTASRTKTGKGRVVPMNSVVREELLKLTEGKGDLEYIFINPETGKPFRDVKNAFKKACGLAGIDGLRFHDLRHTFGTRLAEAGESLHRIAELMGHSNIQMTMRYAHALAGGKHAAVERLVGYQETDCPKIVPNEKQPTARLAVNH